MADDNVGTYQIRTGPLDLPGYAESGGEGLSHAAVKAMLSHMQPEYVKTVGNAYLAAARALGDASARLHRHAGTITEAWSGENAGTALKQLGQLNTTAAELQEKSAQTGTTFSWLGTEILPWYRDQGRTMTDGDFNTGADDQRAIELLDRMDNRLTQGYNNTPEVIQKHLPPGTGTGDVWGDLGDPGRPRVGDTDAGRSPVSDPFSPPPIDPFTKPGEPFAGPGSPSGIGPGGPGSPLPGDPGGVGTDVPDGGSTDLAGMGGGIGADPFGAGLGGGLGGGAGGLGAGAGSIGGPPGSGAPGMIGPGGMGGMGAQKSPGQGRSGSAKTGQSPLMGGAGAGAGGGGAGDEEERERTTWLTEDEDVWGDDSDTAPPVIG
jgi:hypothetical protein